MMLSAANAVFARDGFDAFRVDSVVDLPRHLRMTSTACGSLFSCPFLTLTNLTDDFKTFCVLDFWKRYTKSV